MSPQSTLTKITQLTTDWLISVVESYRSANYVQNKQDSINKITVLLYIAGYVSNSQNVQMSLLNGSRFLVICPSNNTFKQLSDLS